MWRNKLAHSNGVREVAGAGPATPTMKKLSKNIQDSVCLLRIKGNSFRDVAKKLHISLGSAYLYAKQIHLRKSQLIELQRRGYKQGLAKLSHNIIMAARRKGGLNTSGHFRVIYTRNHLLQLLKDFAFKNNRIPTKRDFHSQHGAFLRVFGTWNKAIIEAGFIPNPVLFAKKYTANDGHRCDSLAENH